jgi:hypothetical protein
MHLYEVRPRKDKRGVDLISDVLPFGRLWYGEPNAASNAIGYAMHSSRQRDRDARAQGRFQGVVNRLAILPSLDGHFPLWSTK